MALDKYPVDLMPCGFGEELLPKLCILAASFAFAGDIDDVARIANDRNQRGTPQLFQSGYDSRQFHLIVGGHFLTAADHGFLENLTPGHRSRRGLPPSRPADCQRECHRHRR